MKFMVKALVILFIISLCAIMLTRVSLAESTPCPKGLWHDQFTELVTTAQDSIISEDDTSEDVIQKTMTLYSIQFQLEAFVHSQTVPDCAHSLVNKTIQLIRFEADFQLFLFLQSGEWAVSDEIAESIVDFYTIMLERAVSSLRSASDQVEFVGTVQ